MIIKLNKSHDLDLKNYLIGNMNKTLEILRIYEKNGIKNSITNKHSGDYYGYFLDGKLEGILLFTNNKQLFLSYNNNKILDKLDLLILIKKYKPFRISGPKDEIYNLYLTINKVIKGIEVTLYNYMILDYSKNFIKSDNVQIAKPSDVMENLNFFLEVEKSFKRNHMTINMIKDKIKNNVYVLYKEDKIYAQGFIENKVAGYYQIGGIYTLNGYRKKGYAKEVLEYLIDYIKTEAKKPLLAVVADNTAAIKLYERYGFEKLVEFMVIE